MASTITTTPWRGRKGSRGLTLVELLIASSLTGLVLAGVLSMFLFLGRTGANVANYADMETQARLALERFGQDARQAGGITWNSANSVTLHVNGADIFYTYNSVARTFSRSVGAVTTVLVEGVTDEFSFTGYTIGGTKVEYDLSTAAGRTSASGVTKQLQIYFKASRTDATVARATNTVLSARFILRNKRVTA